MNGENLTPLQKPKPRPGPAQKPTPPPPPAPPAKSMLPLIIIGAVVLLLIIIGGAIIWSQSAKIDKLNQTLEQINEELKDMKALDEAKEEEEEVVAEEAKEAPEVVEEEEDKLPKYTSDLYGYSFNYSDEYVADELHGPFQDATVEWVKLQTKAQLQQFQKLAEQGVTATEGGPMIGFRVVKNPNKLSIIEWAKVYTTITNFEPPTIENESDYSMTKINSYDALSYHGVGLFEFDYLITKLDDSHMLVMTVGTNTKNDPILKDFQDFVASLEIE
jgi:hypothetical protein